MKLAVSFDGHGHITTLFDPARIQNAQGTLEYVPQPGENHQIIDLPSQFHAEPFENLPHVLKIDSSAATPKFVKKT